MSLKIDFLTIILIVPVNQKFNRRGASLSRRSLVSVECKPAISRRSGP
jgi:hypothetical protein